MKYYTILPTAALAPYVRFYWVLEGFASAEEPYIYRSMADGCMEMIFHYQGKFDELLINGEQIASVTAGIDGPSRNFSRFITAQNFKIFGAYLYPFASSILFGLPAVAIVNQQPDLISVLGRQGRELEQRIFGANDNTERVEILSKFLEARLEAGKLYHPAVFSSINYIIESKGTVTVDTLSKSHFLSTRQFERTFKEYAGFAPKLYSRIIRFQSAINEYTNKSLTLTQIALKCGYYDQSHFIHDFKEFSGYHPKSFFGGNNESTGWRDEQ
jgi:AraC-like DNA-binding protein